MLLVGLLLTTQQEQLAQEGVDVGCSLWWKWFQVLEVYLFLLRLSVIRTICGKRFTRVILALEIYLPVIF